MYQIQPSGSFRKLDYAGGVAIVDLRPRNMEPPISPIDIVFGNEEAEQELAEQAVIIRLDSTRSSIDQPGLPVANASESAFGNGVTLPSTGVGERNGDYLAQAEVSSSPETQTPSPDGQAEGDSEPGPEASTQDSEPAVQDETNETSGAATSEGAEAGAQHESGSSPDAKTDAEQKEDPQP